MGALPQALKPAKPSPSPSPGARRPPLSGPPDESPSSPAAAAGAALEAPHTWRILGRPYEDVRESYVMGRELGRGQFGVIRACRERGPCMAPCMAACKAVRKDRLRAARDAEDVRREVRAMEALGGHPAVVKLKGTVEDSKKVYIIMELCEGGELFDRIRERKRYPEAEAAQVFATLASVVSHFQSRGVIHRDLKPENILLSRADSNTMIKVVDFGLAVFTKPGEKLSTMAGSAYYIAPEVLLGSYGREVDMWSIGIVLYILLCGLPPFWHDTEEGIFEAIKKGKFDMKGGPWKNISEGAKDLVRRILVLDPAKRLTPEEAMKHPWVLEHFPIAAAPLAKPESLALKLETELTNLPVAEVVSSDLFRTSTIESVESDFSDFSPRGSRRWTSGDFGGRRLFGSPRIDQISHSFGGSGDFSHLLSGMSRQGSGDLSGFGLRRQGSGDIGMHLRHQGSGDLSWLSTRQSSGDSNRSVRQTSGDSSSFLRRQSSGDLSSSLRQESEGSEGALSSRGDSGDYQNWCAGERVYDSTDAEFLERVSRKLRGLYTEDAASEGVGEGNRASAIMIADAKQTRLPGRPEEERRGGVGARAGQEAEGRMPPRFKAQQRDVTQLLQLLSRDKAPRPAAN